MRSKTLNLQFLANNIFFSKKENPKLWLSFFHCEATPQGKSKQNRISIENQIVHEQAQILTTTQKRNQVKQRKIKKKERNLKRGQVFGVKLSNGVV